MPRTVAEALSAIRGRRAVIVGDLVLDQYIFGETVRVSREAPVLVVKKERTDFRLGGAANTAANLAALGVQTRVVGALADDEGGRRLATMLSEAGVDTSAIARADVATAVKTRVLAGAFGTSRQQVLRIDDEPAGPIGSEVQRAVAARLVEHAATSDVTVVSDYSQGVVVGEVIAAVRATIAGGARVSVDSRYELGAFSGATVVTPNVPEAEALVGFALNSSESVQRAGKLLIERIGCSACLLTQGRHGMSLFRPGGASSHVDIVGEDEVTDVTGAGDTVLATFSAALAAELGFENAMRLANCAAGIVVSKAGTATASPDEILEAAARYHVELEPWAAS